MMELKVWVDGIQRVVCGVTTDTTCQDVVIALAHAMGRTGRFTLIEKWRDTERPLTPSEQPLRMLQKWGEYACEVKFILCQNESDKLKQRDRHKQPDRFTHNFTPPKTPPDTTSIKRNLTFSGAHQTTSTQFSRTSLLKHGGLLENGVSPRSSSHSSTSSTRSSPHPIPMPRQRSPGNLPRPAPRHSPLLSGQNVLPNKPNFTRSSPSQTLNQSSSSPNQHLSLSPHDSSRGRSPSPLASQRHSSPNNYGRGPSLRRETPSPSNKMNTVIAVEHNIDSPLHSRQASAEIEEYDLDSNFPDILRDSKRPDRPIVPMEYRIEEKTDNQPEPERDRLLRLVSLQKERLSVQESQLDVLETEIISLEHKEIEYEQNLQRLTDDLVQLEQREHDGEVELGELSTVQWVDVLAQEEQQQNQLLADVKQLKVKVTGLETQIKSQKVKESELEKKIVEAKQEQETKEKEIEKMRQEKETQCKADIEKVQNDIKTADVKKGEVIIETNKVDEEIMEIEKNMKQREEEFSDLEAELKKVNLEDLGMQSLSPTPGKSADTGEAVLKILEGRLSPRPPVTPTTPTQQAFMNSLASKNPNGVWV